MCGIDPALRTVASPPPGAIGAAEPGLELAGVAESRPFLVEGERVAALGDERRGVSAVFVDGVRVAGGVVTDAGPAANVVIGPALVRRELIGRAGSVSEAVLALPALPMLALEWTRTGGADAGRPLAVALTLLPGREDVRYRVDGPSAVAADPASAAEVHAVVHPEPLEWSAVPAGGGGVTVQATVPAAGRTTLLLVRGGAEDVARTLKAAPHLAAHAVRAAGDAARGGDGGLVLATGVEAIDHGVAWANARLRGALRRLARATTRPGEEDAVFWTVLAAGATGDEEACGAAARVLQARAAAAGGPSALGTLAAARLALTTGDPAPALEAASLLGPDGLEGVRRAADRETWAPWPLALAALADALRDAVPPPRIHELREIAGAPPGRASAVRLPMVGAPRASDGAVGLLERLLGDGGPADPPDAAGGGPLADAQAAWEAFAAGEPERGWPLWRAGLASGLDGDGGRGLWDGPGDEGARAAPVTGTLLAGLALGLLGLRADAPSGRLRLAPDLPGHLTAFRAERIRVGDARLDLDVVQGDGTWRYALTPTAGRTPPMIVFEPSVQGAVARVRIDGEPADLEVVPGAGRSRVRVQIPLDSERTVEVDEAR